MKKTLIALCLLPLLGKAQDIPQPKQDWKTFKYFIMDIAGISISFGILFGAVYIFWLREYWQQQRSIRRGLAEAAELARKQREENKRKL